MAIKEDAECVVQSEQINKLNLGFDKKFEKGDTIYLPNHTAKELSDIGAVTIVNLGATL